MITMVVITIDVTPNDLANIRFGYTPLMQAVSGNWPAGIKILAKAGADLSAVAEHGDNALWIAHTHGHPELVDLLKSLGAKD